MHFPHEITIVTAATGEDGHGNATEDWGEDAERWTGPGWIQQRAATSETHEPGRDPVVTSWVVFLPLVWPNDDDPPELVVIDITARHRVEWESRVFVVDGDPRRPTTPRGPHHIEAALQIVTG